jgi:hypothetical protein
MKSSLLSIVNFILGVLVTLLLIGACSSEPVNNTPQAISTQQATAPRTASTTTLIKEGRHHSVMLEKINRNGMEYGVFWVYPEHGYGGGGVEVVNFTKDQWELAYYKAELRNHGVRSVN